MIDPRDGVAEVDFPGYRVYFTDTEGAIEEWQLSNCRNVLEAVEWADAEARGRCYQLFAEWPLPNGVGIARLLERDGNSGNAA